MKDNGDKELMITTVFLLAIFTLLYLLSQV